MFSPADELETNDVFHGFGGLEAISIGNSYSWNYSNNISIIVLYIVICELYFIL